MKRATAVVALLLTCGLGAQNAEATWGGNGSGKGDGHTTCWTKKSNAGNGKVTYTVVAC